MAYHAAKRTPGYTLTEFVMATAIASVVLIVLIGLFIQGRAIMHSGCVHTWAQQRANSAMGVIGSRLRPAFHVDVYREYGPSPVLASHGNYLCMLCRGMSSAVYKAGTTLYYVPNMTADNRSSSADDGVLATGIMNTNVFYVQSTRVLVKFIFHNPKSTNQEVISAESVFSPRNL